jgi:hypothetical protein
MSSAAMSNASAPVHELVGQWGRPRGFGLGPFGEKWWFAAPTKNVIKPTCLDYEIPVTGTGVEVIEVIDVDDVDGVARYRQYLVNPDGELVRVSFAPQYATIRTTPAGQLRGVLKRMKMMRGQVGKPDAHQDERQPDIRTADIIEFPRSPIVRHIRHGNAVVVS